MYDILAAIEDERRNRYKIFQTKKVIQDNLRKEKRFNPWRIFQIIQHFFIIILISSIVSFPLFK